MVWVGGPHLIFRPNGGPQGQVKIFFRLGPTLISSGLDEQAPHVLNDLNPPLQGSYINIVRYR